MNERNVARGVRLGLGAALIGSALLAHADGSVGIVLMHGKKGSPEHVQPLAEDLAATGYLVVTPEMPWSGDRAYDRTLEESHREIDLALELLRQQGATRLVVAGHSMGANMAMGYAATHPSVDAVMALGPGQTVESGGFVDRLGDSVAKARTLVAEGKGSAPVMLNDLHLGKVSSVDLAPAIYLSYFDPEGLANMPKTVTRIGVPLLWTVGSEDKNMLDRGSSYALALAPANPLNHYEVVVADHMGTPTASREAVLQWLGRVFPDTARAGD